MTRETEGDAGEEEEGGGRAGVRFTETVEEKEDLRGICEEFFVEFEEVVKFEGPEMFEDEIDADKLDDEFTEDKEVVDSEDTIGFWLDVLTFGFSNFGRVTFGFPTSIQYPGVSFIRELRS